MELYEHTTSGGAQYYSTTYTEPPSGEREGTFPGVIMRTDGGELEIFTEALKKQGIRLVIN